MSEDITKKVPKDPQRVDVSEHYEVQFWAEKFGCTRAQLETAVKKVGVMVSDVERELQVKS